MQAVDKKTIDLLRLHLTTLSARKLPYIIVGLIPDILIYTNVKPATFDLYVKISCDDRYHFVKFNTQTIIDLLYTIFPQYKGAPIIINAPGLLKLLADNDGVFPEHTMFSDQLVCVPAQNDIPEDTAEDNGEKSETSDEPATNDNEDQKKQKKEIGILWCKTTVQLDLITRIYETLCSKLPNAIAFNIDPMMMNKRDVNYISIAEAPLEHLGRLRFSVRCPLMDGWDYVSGEYPKKAKASTFTLVARTWVHQSVLHYAIVYEDPEVHVWSIAPGVIWFPKETTKGVIHGGK